jgi:selenocysteine-specific elongation factor
MTLDDLRLACPLEKDVLDGMLALLKAQGRLAERNQRLASPRHQATFSDEDAKRAQAIEALFREAGFHPPSPEEVVEQTRLPAAAVQKILKILREHNTLVQAEDILFHREAVDRARELLAEHFRGENRLESVQFKYILDTTRKFALPLLDYFDRQGVTRRVGNTRFPGTGKR